MVHATEPISIGIGNATLLRQFGIEALIDLPGVGENLQVSISSPARPGPSTLLNFVFAIGSNLCANPESSGRWIDDIW
jgi:hypothetical protein